MRRGGHRRDRRQQHVIFLEKAGESRPQRLDLGVRCREIDEGGIRRPNDAGADRMQLTFPAGGKRFDGRRDLAVHKRRERAEGIAKERQRHFLHRASEIGQLRGRRGDGGGDLGIDRRESRVGDPTHADRLTSKAAAVGLGVPGMDGVAVDPVRPLQDRVAKRHVADRAGHRRRRATSAM